MFVNCPAIKKTTSMDDLMEGLDDSIEFGASMRKEFSLLEGESFLNHGSYGTVPKRIQQVQRRFLGEIDAHPDDWYRRKVYGYWQESQKAVADFLHCEPQDIVFVENATTGVNTVLKSCQYKKGDIILYTQLTYTAISFTCDAAATIFDVLGVKACSLVLQLPIVSEDEVCQKYEDFFKANPNTRIAVIDYITSPTAILMPVQRLVQLCHKYGVLVMIDGAHTPGQLPVNLTELGADFYTGNFHKWVYTPRGCAVLHVKREHHPWVKPLVTSWNYKKSLDQQFFMVATNDQTPYTTVKYAIEYYKRIGGMDRITKYTSDLATKAHEYLIKKLGVEPLQIPKSMEAPNMRLVKLPDLPQYAITREGSIAFHTDVRFKYNIQCAIETTQGHLYLRISTQVYNYLEEYKRLAECLLEIIQESKQ